MLFNSLHFLIFFLIIFISYYLSPHKYRWVILLLASYYFYMSWNPKYILLILFFTIINYTAAILIEKTTSKKNKKLYLYFALISSLSLLAIFKYFNFISQSIIDFLNLFSLNLDPFIVNILLPVGISFYTFQTIGYLLDVYWGKIKAEKHFGIFALYVSFFPQLVAGPIERAKHLIPQFRKNIDFKYENIIQGLKIVIWGFFLKLVMADNLALEVDKIYASPEIYSGLTLLVATYLFAFQIFGDFAGYSLIAIGISKILGFDLMKNFNQPYLATSITDFWRRWHISLSTWFRDYVYFPMGGSKVSMKKVYFNLFIVFLISGLWHGASWNFVIWGIIHGVIIVVEKIFSNHSKIVTLLNTFFNKYILNLTTWFITFHIVLLSWIFFRAETLSQSVLILQKMTDFSSYAYTPSLTLFLFGIIGFVMVVEIILNTKKFKQYIQQFEYSIIEILFFVGLIMIILFFGVLDSTQFIYFQF